MGLDIDQYDAERVKDPVYQHPYQETDQCTDTGIRQVLLIHDQVDDEDDYRCDTADVEVEDYRHYECHKESNECRWVIQIETFLLRYRIPSLKCCIGMSFNDI